MIYGILFISFNFLKKKTFLDFWSTWKLSLIPVYENGKNFVLLDANFILTKAVFVSKLSSSFSYS